MCWLFSPRGSGLQKESHWLNGDLESTSTERLNGDLESTSTESGEMLPQDSSQISAFQGLRHDISPINRVNDLEAG